MVFNPNLSLYQKYFWQKLPLENVSAKRFSIMVMILFILCPSWRNTKFAKIVGEAFLSKIMYIHSTLSQENVLRVAVIFFSSHRANSLRLSIFRKSIYVSHGKELINSLG